MYTVQKNVILYYELVAAPWFNPSGLPKSGPLTACAIYALYITYSLFIHLVMLMLFPSAILLFCFLF